MALTLLLFRSENVPQKSFRPLYLPRSSFLEALGSAFVCFEFWHDDFQFSIQRSPCSRQQSAISIRLPIRSACDPRICDRAFFSTSLQTRAMPEAQID